MDVRCEKCGTEYELDEARLKPGGVTVKCTNCGHMFKIRKRTTTNAGVPAVSAPSMPSGSSADRGRASSKPPPRTDSVLTDDPTKDEAATAVDRQWLIRLENGDQKSCRELATLQQWIVAGVVTRESLISRTGKTWKRLGDVTELAQYFDIGDEARTTREDRGVRTTGKPATKPAAAGTLLGIGTAAAATDDDDAGRATGQFTAAREPGAAAPSRAPATATPPPPPAKAVTRTPAMGSGIGAATLGTAPTQPSTGPIRRPPTQPPPPPAAKAATATAKPSIPPPTDGRSTAMWASDPIKADAAGDAGPTGPVAGKLSKAGTEPAFAKGDAPAAFAGRVRVGPSDEPAFGTGKLSTSFDDDDDVLPPRRGSRGGLVLVLVTLLLGGAAAAAVYVFVIAKDTPAKTLGTTPIDAAMLAVTPLDDAAVVTPTATPDAAAVAPPTGPLETARGELATDDEARLRTALQSIATTEDPPALAMRAILASQIAQDLTDRAALTADKPAAEALKKEARTLVIEAATLAQRAHKALPDDAAANLAMASVLRLQAKSAKDVKRYADTAKAKGGTDWARDVALADALVLVRDNKLDDAKAALAAIDQGENALEASNDVRARFQLARIAQTQGHADEARKLADSILAAQPGHGGTRALVAKLDSAVSTNDPLPPEEGSNQTPQNPTNPNTLKPDAGVKPTRNPGTDVGSGDSYDKLVSKANALAERNCTAAMELYQKALDQKPNGVEALTGMGYCHIDGKQFSSAFSKFRAALAASPRYEPALWGVAEAYQQQGRKEQAIEAYRAYLEAYPSSQKAIRQLERLGVSPDGDKPPDNGGTPPTTPDKPPETPTTPPTPPSDQPQKQPDPPSGEGSSGT